MWAQLKNIIMHSILQESSSSREQCYKDSAGREEPNVIPLPKDLLCVCMCVLRLMMMMVMVWFVSPVRTFSLYFRTK